jgi:hypothetical protein
MFSWSNILGVIGLGLAVGGTIFSMVQQGKAADVSERATDAQRRALSLQQKKSNLAVRRQKLQTIREGRIQRASAISRAQGQTGGVAGSLRGGLGSIITQTSSNLGYLNQAQALTISSRAELAQSTIFSNQAVSLNNQAAIGRGFASIGGSIFSSRDDLSKLTRQVGLFS